MTRLKALQFKVLLFITLRESTSSSTGFFFSSVSLIFFKALPVSQLYKLFTSHAPLIQENAAASRKERFLMKLLKKFVLRVLFQSVFLKIGS